jgi:hypothetical protein
MFKYSRHNLKKLEDLFEEMGYVVRYEKGNFQSGYCLVENRKMAVVNKFFELESRINCLLEILGEVAPEEAQLSEPSARFYRELSALRKQKESGESSK